MVQACLPPTQGDSERPRANVDNSGVQEVATKGCVVLCYCLFLFGFGK